MENADHILRCLEAGRIEIFHSTADHLEDWMDENDKAPDLADSISEFVHGRGGVAMTELCRGLDPRFARLGRSQDEVSEWRRFLEGMVVEEVEEIQCHYLSEVESKLSITRWMTVLTVKLLEITHRQWIYCNLKVHDAIAGELVTKKKEELQQEIEKQCELGDDGLLPEDKFLAEVNLSSLEQSSGEWQAYWLLAICVARKARMLRDREVAATQSAAPEETGV
eukprot:CAMPEP_0172531740 /NCGR_PEP_ID=MMETSP1067-20121228/5014_1 /TAXON_ID=265564 ORGANISM="Thalassiosira punctigera, Strain Tpunct2005C2" /NCGR_SAMPLE_ID=MMETSP1067 /ASSEMBLY_ACC=CAM_ASM_000444 /LENGTH=222 /DNA_ID=CAMNT_0013316143 /DNA_START=548 /DNA_END=1216 /DNA_ORIENTATION=+